MARAQRPAALFRQRTRPVDHRRHRGAAFRHVELPVVQPGIGGADAARRGQGDRQSVRPHGCHRPHVRAGQAGAGALQPARLRAGDAHLREDGAAVVPAGTRHGHGAGGRPQRRFGCRLHASLHAADAPPGLCRAQPRRAGTGSQPRRLRHGFAARALRIGAGAGLQEPLSVDHPHLPDRPDRPGRRTGASGRCRLGSRLPRRALLAHEALPAGDRRAGLAGPRGGQA
ncbi:hypothetical protein D9M72_475620 [compost metagenome]